MFFIPVLFLAIFAAGSFAVKQEPEVDNAEQAMIIMEDEGDY